MWLRPACRGEQGRGKRSDTCGEHGDPRALRPPPPSQAGNRKPSPPERRTRFRSTAPVLRPRTEDFDLRLIKAFLNSTSSPLGPSTPIAVRLSPHVYTIYYKRQCEKEQWCTALYVSPYVPWCTHRAWPVYRQYNNAETV
ncbi:hypothetical protein NDU88_002065 [Pleurodeles waltl]|uniref:Uncharacterized protein n=1 Tax=Pleurodeles waltl TaxID=8319 RepID=A0AAV7W274_PLEWA|nr:hypothetical protein NDU88_002065 [Pleurodeles waltl]